VSVGTLLGVVKGRPLLFSRASSIFQCTALRRSVIIIGNTVRLQDVTGRVPVEL
jgi:hypothetical protein